MGNHLDIEGYLSELVGRRKIELGDRDKNFLFELLSGAKSVTGLYRLINKKYEWKPPPEEDGAGGMSQGIDAAKDIVYYITRGPLSRPAVRKRIRKLVRYGLIEGVDKESLTEMARFDANLRRAKLFAVTEYGLFCILSQEVDYTSGFFLRHWQSKVMSTLLSPYFEKKSFERLTTKMHFTIVLFLLESCKITIERLSQIEAEEKKGKGEAKRQEQIKRLEDDLLWHAKSFVLRLFVDSAASNKDKCQRSRHILSFLAYDKKFYKLADTTIREILSYYKGGKLLGR
jgi:hypothetical protein